MTKARELAELARTISDTSDATAITIDSSENTTFTGVVTANAGVVIDSMTIDAGQIDVGSGNLTLDVAANIILDADGGEISLKDGGTEFGQFAKSGNDFRINHAIQDGRFVFRGNDGGSIISALTLDIANGGNAAFSGSVTADGLTVDGTSTFSPNSGTLDIKVGTHDATNNVRLNAGGTTSTYLEYRGYLGHIFDVNTTRMMTLTSTGLGIGTSSIDSDSLLHLKSTQPNIFFEDTDDNKSWRLEAGSVFKLQNVTTSNEVFRIDQTGNLKLGNTADFSSPKMYVYGTAVNQNSGYYQLAIESDLAATSTPKAGISFRGEYNTSNGAHMDLGIIQGEKENATSGQTGGKLTFHTRTHNGNITERVVIDSGGKVLVGKGSSNYASEGIELRPNEVLITKNGLNPLSVRGSGNGSYISINSAGTTIGSIGTNSGYMVIGSPVGTNAHLLIGNNLIHPATSTGGVKDAAIDLGGSSNRFKDLYLSGGVYVGGTGSANHLDDYEEGTWTPAFANGFDGNYTVRTGQYTKIGRQVIAAFHLDINSASTGSTGNGIQVSGLPFLPDVGVNYGGSTSIHGTSWTTARTSLNMLVGDNSTSAGLYYNMCSAVGAAISPTYADIGTGNLLAVLIYNADT